MFWNHPTQAEESARPEGNLDQLAAIITSPARYEANGVKGPGLYAEAKVMAADNATAACTTPFDSTFSLATTRDGLVLGGAFSLTDGVSVSAPIAFDATPAAFAAALGASPAPFHAAIGSTIAVTRTGPDRNRGYTWTVRFSGLYGDAAPLVGVTSALTGSSVGVEATVVRQGSTRDVQTLLAVGEEALRSPAVGAVLLSAWGEARAFSLTASRRLALAAETGGATLFLARAGALPCPSAAETRWSVASCASEPLEGGAPWRPSFSATLLRRRGGGATGTWIMEWDREQRTFRAPAPLSGGLVPLAAQRPTAASGAARRRAA
jgi:hypothetical protein